MDCQLFEIDKNKPSHIIYYANNKEINQDVEPILELYRGKLYTKLIKYFIDDCITILGTKIFSIKKSYGRTITNLLSSWIFTLYIDYDFSGDYFFPNNYHNTTPLKNILLDLCKYDLTIIDANNKVDKILIKLKQNYKYQLELLNNYINSNNYKNIKNNYDIKKFIIDNNKFCSFKIITTFKINDKKLQNTLNNILIPIKVYNKLADRYIGDPKKMDQIIWAIIYRYQLLGSNNHQLAVLPNIMKNMYNDYQLNFECFASAINSTFSSYCSIYWDLEKYFGSVGSFFNFIPIKGTFGFNPPYQKDIIEVGITKLLSILDNTNNELTFIITIPIWDNEGKLLFNNNKQNIEYGDFEIIKTIKDSKYLKALRMVSKEDFTYLDHNFELYKNKTIQNTYIIILSNRTININCLNLYKFEKI